MARMMEIATPLGPEVLLFHTLEAREELGRLFEYRIQVLAERNDIDPKDLLGKHVTVKLEVAEGGPRCFDGYVTGVGLGTGRGRYVGYDLVARPWLWLLTRSADCRIFQNQKVPDIIKEVFADYPAAAYEFKLTGQYEPWEYCVQYRESDFDFVSRLMEQEGIYYYFTHTDGRHTLVLADSPSAHDDCPGCKKLPFVVGERSLRFDDDRVSAWSARFEVQPGAMVIDDFDFVKPSVELQAKTRVDRGHAEAKHEWYDYPGAYDTVGEGDNYVRVRLDEYQARYKTQEAVTDARGVQIGHLFELTGHPRGDQNAKYLITGARFSLKFSDYESLDDRGSAYECVFTCMEAAQQFRPQRLTRRAVVRGLHTAIVVGPAGEEIFTDKYGRVKVQFHWDRRGKHDENASCWIRVSHPWAGKNFGMMAIPRIGQEVVVEFLEGDPDRPLITGRVYNAEQMPPWELPANKTQTGVLTRSSKGGSAANANAIRFEDLKGSEQLWIHAEKNQDIEVENDETHWVGHDRTKTIDHDETTHVKHDRTETVDNNETITIHGMRTEVVDKDETITIHMNRTEVVDKEENITIHGGRTELVDKEEKITIGGGRTENVAKDESITISGGRTESVAKDESITISGGRTENVSKDESITIGGGRTESVAKDESITISGGRTENVSKDESVTVGGGRTVSIGKDDGLTVAKNLTISAGDSITISTGSASITMKKDGTITIKGKDITIDGSGKINVKASSDVVIKGSKVGIN
jgi:type VI secretion system secreted protein VgrG